MVLKFFIALAFIIGTNIEAKERLFTGVEIKNKYKLLQSMTIPAIYDNGMVLTKYASVYKIDNQCIIVSRLDNESNFGGYEDIIYFKRNIMLRSSKQSFFSIFLDDEAKIKSKSIKYGDFLNGKEVQQGLKEDFIQYRKKFNKNTLRECK